MNILFKDLSERDMDMLFLEEFASSYEFCRMFLSKAGIDSVFSLVSMQHSKMDYELGESDMTIVFEIESRKHALLIEDKIDAIAMPNQSSRYKKRGEKGIAKGYYDSYSVFIVAPEAYLESNAESKKYPNVVTYEEILNYFYEFGDNRTEFKISQISQAIHKCKNGYQVEEHEKVTKFWKSYLTLMVKEYPQLKCSTTLENLEKKGARAFWPEFYTDIHAVRIMHKSNKGCIDLQFPKRGEDFETFVEMIGSKISIENSNLILRKAGRSAVIRFYVSPLDFRGSFTRQKEEVEYCFSKIQEMMNIAHIISLEK